MAVDVGDDPFAGSSLLSLLPRTLGGAAEHAAEKELDSIGAFLESMTLKGSRELLEQAQTIAKSSLNVINLDSEDGDDAVLANGKDRPQGRRPALGRKRARFSLKPDSSQSVTNVNIVSNIDGIEDPEEYFLACENLDNAGKELKKLKRDISTELLEHHQSTTVRKCRPGILGKTARYKHHFPALADTAEGIVISQDESPDRGNYILSHTPTDVDSSKFGHPKAIDQPQNSQAREISELFDANDGEGSVSQIEEKFDDLYYRLLSCEDLDGEKGQAFLRESLQIQQTDVGKMRLPGLFGSQKDVVNPVNSMSVRKKLENLKPLQTSPSLPKSPLAAIFALQRRLSKIPLKDQYSLHPSDETPRIGESSLTRGQERHLVSPLVNVDHCDTSGAITDGAPTPTRTSMKRVASADKMHSSVLKSDKTVGEMIMSWKSHKLISLKDSSRDLYLVVPRDDVPHIEEFSQSRHQDNYPISPSADINNSDTSGLVSDGAATPRTKEKSLNLEDKPHSPFPSSDRMVGNKVTSKQQPVEHLPCSLERSAACEPSRFDNDQNVVSIGFDSCLKGEDNGRQMSTSTFEQPESGLQVRALEMPLTGHDPSLLEKSKNHNFSKSGGNKDAMPMEPDSCFPQEENNIEHDTSASVRSGPGFKSLPSGPVNPNAKEGSIKDGDTNTFGYDATMAGQVNDTEQMEQGSKDGEAVKDKSNTPQAVSLTDGHQETMCITLGETDVGPLIDSASPSNRRKKRKAPSQRQKKRKSPSERPSPANSELLHREGMRQKTALVQKKQKSISKRQSLAGAGTTWQAGVRRSTRIKSRPLQYWCGERFLYGRIHDSLATVIGVKYASPGDSKLKVKSYVSEEYADLVAQAAVY